MKLGNVKGDQTLPTSALSNRFAGTGRRFKRAAPFTFLGFELYWFVDRKGTPRVMRRTARKKLQGECRRVKEWIRLNRHLDGRKFIAGLNRRLVGHYNYYGLRGNSRSLWRFYRWATECAFKWLNRRGGKRKSFTWKAFSQALRRAGAAAPGSRKNSISTGCMHNAIDRRESEYNRGTGCGSTAPPGLGGGRRVTGVPTARCAKKYSPRYGE